MAYAGMDTQGARALGQVLRDAAGRADTARQQTVGALALAELSSEAPQRLGLLQDGLSALGTGVADKADLAERFTVDPQAAAASIGGTAAELGTVLSGLIGLAGPADLRAVFVGLPAAGTDAALDAALARLTPAVLPALLSGGRPELSAVHLEDLRLLALRLGIAAAGPPVRPEAEEVDTGGGFAGLIRRLRRETGPRTGTEVFWNDFWADGRTVDEVLADPQRLLDWVAGTFELDRRLSVAAGLPGLGDMLASYDFATVNSDADELAAIVSEAEAQFAAIGDWLPAFLAGRDATAPDATQLAQTLAFAARVGWADPGTGGDDERFAAAVAYLRANRVLQSALLPTGFGGAPLAFFNAQGIALTLQVGRDAGVVDQAFTIGIAGVVDQVFARLGVDLSSPAPVELTEQLQQQLFGLVLTQVPGSLAGTPAIQAQFVAALGHLRQATSGPELRARIVDVLAAFRTIAVTGAPALTERQLAGIVGADVLGVLGRTRLRLRAEDAVRKHPEFILIAQRWGVPGQNKQQIGKYRFSWSFDELGVLTGIQRKKPKKKGLLSRVFDTIKSIGKAIVESWKDNPFKAIFQVGKIALGALAFLVPGAQALGVASFALTVGESVYHAIEGDWLAALGAGLSAFTAGADIFGAGATTAIEALRGGVVSQLFGGSTLAILENAKRAFDIGTAVLGATRADSLVGAIGAGLGAVATGLGAGGELLGNLGAIEPGFARQLVELGTTVRDVSRLVAPAAGLVEALENGDLLAAFGNGLAVVSGGSAALINPKGVFTSQAAVEGTLFDFTDDVRRNLQTLATGTGVAAAVTRAIAAADAGNAFLAGSALAEAVQRLNNPQTTVIGDRAEIAQRIAEVGVVLEGVFKGANPAAAAPILLERLARLTDAISTPVLPPLPVARKAAGVPPPAAAGSGAGAGAVPAASTGTPPAFPPVFAPGFLPGVLPEPPPGVPADPFDPFRQFAPVGAGAVDAGAGLPGGRDAATLDAATLDPATLDAATGETATLFGATLDAATLTGGGGSDLLRGDAGPDTLVAATTFDVPPGMAVSTDPLPELTAPALPGLPVGAPIGDARFATIPPVESALLAGIALEELRRLGAIPPPVVDTNVNLGSPGSKKAPPVQVSGGTRHTVTPLPDGGTRYTVTETFGPRLDATAGTGNPKASLGKIGAGLEVKIEHTVPPGISLTGGYVPGRLADLAPGESVRIAYDGSGALWPKLALKSGYEHYAGREVLVEGTEGGLLVTVYDTSGGSGELGLTAKILGGAVGYQSSDDVGRQYYVSRTAPDAWGLIDEALRYGGALDRVPDALVSRAGGTWTGSADLAFLEWSGTAGNWSQTELLYADGGSGTFLGNGGRFTYTLGPDGERTGYAVTLADGLTVHYSQEAVARYRADGDAEAYLRALGVEPSTAATQELRDQANSELVREVNLRLIGGGTVEPRLGPAGWDAVRLAYDADGVPIDASVTSFLGPVEVTVSRSQLAAFGGRLQPDDLLDPATLARLGAPEGALDGLAPVTRREVARAFLDDVYGRLDRTELLGRPSAHFPALTADEIAAGAPEGTSVAFPGAGPGAAPPADGTPPLLWQSIAQATAAAGGAGPDPYGPSTGWLLPEVGLATAGWDLTDPAALPSFDDVEIVDFADPATYAGLFGGGGDDAFAPAFDDPLPYYGDDSLPYYGGESVAGSPLDYTDTWSPTESWDFGQVELYEFDDSATVSTGDYSDW